MENFIALDCKMGQNILVRNDKMMKCRF